MNVYSGDPQLFVNKKVQEIDLSSFSYQSYDRKSNQELLISSESRNAENSPTGDYYI